MTPRQTAVLVALTVALGASAPAVAHQSAIKYVELRADGAAVDVTLRASPLDVTAALGLPDDARPSMAEALAAGPAVAAELASYLTLRAGEVPCPASAPTVAAADDGRFLAARWRATCPAAPAALTVDLAAFFARSTAHQAVIRLLVAGEPTWDGVVSATDPTLTLALHGARPTAAWAWIRSGVDHIWGGLDHVAFVLTLLLVVALARGPDGAWRRRPLRQTLRATGLIITTFTVAHSLTLIAASLGVLTLPAVLVESLIAASIAFTALEDVVRPDTRWRVPLTLGFGLVHGLGFAGVLAELLPPDDVIAPLLLFNLGVELGQLAIVCVVLPLLIVAIDRLGAERYRRIALPALALPLAALGLVWVLERVLEITVLGL
ncbi:MAG: HupE/UreJ family protein [Kofleriaceae bacterium]